MLTKQDSDEFLVFLRQYADFYAEFVDIEQQKYDVITKNDLLSLDNFVSKEQAYLLKSRGLELQRDKLMEKYGFPEITLRKFILELEESSQENANHLFLELSETLKNLKDVNSRCNSLTELRLHRIETEINNLSHRVGSHPDYSSTAAGGKRPINTISKKI